MASVTSTSGSFKVRLLDSHNAEPKTTKAELTGPDGKIWHIELLQGATAGNLDQTKLEPIAELFNEIFTGSSSEHTELQAALMALPNGNHLDIQEQLSDTTTSSSTPPTEGVCPRKTIQWPRGNGGPNANIGNQQNIMAIWEKLFPSRLEDAGMCSYNFPDVPTHTPQLKKPEPNDFQTPKYDEIEGTGPIKQLSPPLTGVFTPLRSENLTSWGEKEAISDQERLIKTSTTPLEKKELLSHEEFRRLRSEKLRHAARKKKPLAFTVPSAQQQTTVSSFPSSSTSLRNNGETARLAPPLTSDPRTSGLKRELGDALAKAQELSAAWDGSHVGNPQSRVWQTSDRRTTQQTSTPSHLMPSPAIVEQALIQPAETSVALTDRSPIYAQDDMGGVEALGSSLPNTYPLGGEFPICEPRVSSASTEFEEEKTTGSEPNRNSQEADERSWSSLTPVALGGLAGFLITGNPGGAIIGAAIASTLRGS